MSFDGEAYQAEVEQLYRKGFDFTHKDALELAALLHSEAARKALARIMEQVFDGAVTFRNLDLTSQEGIGHGIQLQGQTTGVLSVIDSLCSFAAEGNSDNG